MDAPFVKNLNDQISKATDPSERAMLLADLAAYKARVGDFDGTDALISELRAQYGDGRNARVSIMIMAVEAQQIYFKQLGVMARDRMARAQLLSIAIRDAKLTALTSAWLAHIDFNFQKNSEMARNIRMSIDTISKSDNLAASRLALTLGDAFFAAELPVHGKKWYSKAHDHAVKLGDHTAIAALTYNKAALGTFVARIQSIERQMPVDQISLLAGEVKTARSYQAVVQVQSLQNLLSHATSGVQMLQQDYESALKSLQELLACSAVFSPVGHPISFKCDIILCLSKTGRKDEARSLLDGVTEVELEELAADDRLIALAALQKAVLELGEVGLTGKYGAAFDSALAEYQNKRAELRKILAPYEANEIYERI
jgi:hypothetical protein